MKHISGYRDKGLGKAFYLFILPAFVLYLIFFLLPFFLGVQYSFLNWNGKTPDIPIQMSAKKFNLLNGIEMQKNRIVLLVFILIGFFLYSCFPFSF